MICVIQERLSEQCSVNVNCIPIYLLELKRSESYAARLATLTSGRNLRIRGNTNAQVLWAHREQQIIQLPYVFK